MGIVKNSGTEFIYESSAIVKALYNDNRKFTTFKDRQTYINEDGDLFFQNTKKYMGTLKKSNTRRDYTL